MHTALNGWQGGVGFQLFDRSQLVRPPGRSVGHYSGF